jgi:hypothetical protein
MSVGAYAVRLGGVIAWVRIAILVRNVSRVDRDTKPVHSPDAFSLVPGRGGTPAKLATYSAACVAFYWTLNGRQFRIWIVDLLVGEGITIPANQLKPLSPSMRRPVSVKTVLFFLPGTFCF